ncbi:MAG: EAL domain-containing protein [Candidatus Thiodiazotropha sp. (ex Lucinoma borealis)]|nr:EAL domain-containing protein [Candidatus Thiodiazotropha sp. (ex Lucinoma borealis)]
MLVLILLTGQSLATESVAASTPTRHILLLNSYHQSLQWEEDIYSAIKEILRPAENNLELHVENMDTKRVPYSTAYREQLVARYRGAYQRVGLDLILATDNNAYDFLRMYRDELFPGVPVVFCGVNNFDPIQLRDLSDFTGVVEVFDARATATLALQMHPEAREILVINDHLPTGKAWTQEIQQDLSDLPDHLQVRYAGDWSMTQLLKEIQNLPQQSFVLLGVYFRDAEGRFFPAQESTALISAASKVPIYGLLDFYLGHGLVGGNLISGYSQGQAAARIAFQILGGMDPSAIPVQLQGANRNMFDYQQLQRWGIDESQLPPGSQMLNRPYSIYDEFKFQIWIVLAMLLLLSFIILVLTRNVLARRRAEIALLATQNNLEQEVQDSTYVLKARERDLRMLLEHIPLRVFYKNRDSTYVTCNNAFARDYDLDTQKLQGMNDFDLLSEDIAQQYYDNDMQVMTDGQTLESDNIYRVDDLNILIHSVKTPVCDEQGDVVGLLGIFWDVTERRQAEQLLRSSEEQYRSLVESVTTEYLVYRHDINGVFNFVSPSVKSILGYEPHEFMRDYKELISSEPFNQQAIESTNRAVHGEKQPSYEVKLFTKQGRRCILRVSESPLFDEQGVVVGVQGIAADTTEAWLSAIQLQLRNRIMEMITGKVDEDEIINTLVCHIENIYPDALCSVLRLDAHDKTLHTVSAPHLPDFYVAAIEGLKIGDGVGSCGTAAFRREMVIVEDLLSHPYWAPYRDLIQQTPMRACWSQPIISRNGTVLGTFAMYYQTAKSPQDDELKLIRSAADLASIAMDTVRAEQTLRMVEERERLLLESSNEGMFGMDLDGVTTFVNPAAAELLGYPVEEITGQPLHTIVHYAHEDGRPLDISECRMLGAIRNNRDYHVTDEVLWRKDGSCFPVEFWSTPVRRGDEVVGAVVSFHDISERREADERIEHLAFHDSLTGLPNRMLLKEKLRDALSLLKRYSSSFAIYLLDLDHFKDVNDSLGHPAGDELLQQVAQRLKASVRDEDILARMGGDEFALIQQHAEDVADVSLLSQRIIDFIRQPFEIKGHQVVVGVSIGVQLVKEVNGSCDVLLANADLALYRAKENGRGQFIFYEDAMTRRLQFEVELINHLPQAIDEGEIYVVYQSQHELVDDHLCGVEALVRWHHKRYGLIAPSDFIPIVEKRGVVDLIGDFVLWTACIQARQWLDAGLSFGRVAVNISASQVLGESELRHLADIIRQTGVPFSAIELELTESVLFQLDDKARQWMSELVAEGLSFAIDDFGTGYSSLLYLRQFYLQKLKIDREFIADMLDDPGDFEIVKATIALGTALGMTVIAEGIETQQQLEVLRANGCDQGQGFYYSRPCLAEEMTTV